MASTSHATSRSRRRTLDRLDEAIIAALQEDASITNAGLANVVGSTDSTVRRRRKRLLDSGVVRLTATVDPFQLGYDVMALIGIHVDSRKMREAERVLAAMPELRFVGLMLGTYDFLTEAWFRSTGCAARLRHRGAQRRSRRAAHRDPADREAGQVRIRLGSGILALGPLRLMTDTTAGHSGREPEVPGGAGRTRIRGCAVLDPLAELGVRFGMDIVIEGRRIEAIEPAGTVDGDRREARIEGKGTIAVPGLVNAHTHSAENLLRGVAAGGPLELWLLEVFAFRGMPSDRELYLSALVGAAEMLASGVTTVLDHFGLGPRTDAGGIDAVVRAYRDIGMRAAVAPMLEDRDAVRAVATEDRPELQAMLDEGYGPQETPTEDVGRLIDDTWERWHGEGEGRIHCLAGPSSLLWASDELLERCRQIGERDGSGLHLHAAETAFQDQLARERFGESTIAALDRRGLLGPRTSLAHCVHLTEADIDLLADRRVTVVHNPVSNLRLAAGVAPLPRLLERGVTVALGTDGAASNDSQDLPEAMKIALLLPNRDGIPTGMPTERDAVAMATSAGAGATGWSGELGALEVGRLADVVLLALDSPALAPLNDASRQWVLANAARAVRTVIVNGDVVLDGGGPTRVDMAPAYEELRAGADRRRSSAATDERRRELIDAYRGFYEGRVQPLGAGSR